MRNPYKLKSGSYENKAVSKKLIKIIKTYQKRLQSQSDLMNGKGKYKVSFAFASEKIGELLK